MARKVRPETLSEAELKQLLKDKRREARRERLAHFRKTGRLVDVVPVPTTTPHKTIGGIDLENTLLVSKADKDREKRQTLMNRVLLGVEILAIVGLFYIVFSAVGLVQQLNEEAFLPDQMPTASPTPLITAVILPSGHTPPTDPNGAQFNNAEIPEHLRPLVQSYIANLSIPTPSPEQAKWIEIPAVNVSAPIVQGDGWDQLKRGVGQHVGSGNPGENGNMVLSAHNDIYGQIFRYLDQLQSGDEIIIQTDVRSYTYIIDKETQLVDPTAVQVMDSTTDPTITLISCYPYLVNSQRIIIKASLSD
jgi:sortase A